MLGLIEAVNEYNLTREEMEMQVNESTANITGSELFREANSTASWNRERLQNQMSIFTKYPLVRSWIDVMYNATNDNFKNDQCGCQS